MEFLVIMVVGTLVAIWIVMGLRPKHPIQSVAEDFSRISEQPTVPPVWKKGVVNSEPMDELEYLRAVEQHEKDPAHYPFPSPPSRVGKTESAHDDC